MLQETGPLTEQAKQHAIQDLLSKTTHDMDYYVLLVGAILIALGAIFTDSIPGLIASMIVAPLAYPILLLGLGMAAGNMRLIGRALAMLTISSIVALSLAIGLTWAFGSARVHDANISFTINHEIAVVVAIVSGIIAAYGLVRPKVSSAITGVAIAVSLMPPLVATGVSLAPGGGESLPGSFGLFLLNIIGISLASCLVFLSFGMGQSYRALSAKK